MGKLAPDTHGLYYACTGYIQGLYFQSWASKDREGRAKGAMKFSKTPAWSEQWTPLIDGSKPVRPNSKRRFPSNTRPRRACITAFHCMQIKGHACIHYRKKKMQILHYVKIGQYFKLYVPFAPHQIEIVFCLNGGWVIISCLRKDYLMAFVPVLSGWSFYFFC